jgi:hypothetical protein
MRIAEHSGFLNQNDNNYAERRDKNQLFLVLQFRINFQSASIWCLFCFLILVSSEQGTKHLFTAVTMFLPTLRLFPAVHIKCYPVITFL